MIHIINNQTILLETLIRWCVIGGRSIIGNQTKLKAGLSYHKLVGWGRLCSTSLIILFLHLHLVMYLFLPHSLILHCFCIQYILDPTFIILKTPAYSPSSSSSPPSPSYIYANCHPLCKKERF